MELANPKLIETDTEPREFPLGWVAATPGAQMAVPAHVIFHALHRHARCDWGEVGTEDWMSNEEALTHGLRLLSVYRDETTGVRFWVITEADRSTTTVLLPNEY